MERPNFLPTKALENTVDSKDKGVQWNFSYAHNATCCIVHAWKICSVSYRIFYVQCHKNCPKNVAATSQQIQMSLILFAVF